MKTLSKILLMSFVAILIVLNAGEVFAASDPRAKDLKGPKAPVRVNSDKVLKALDVLRDRPALSKKDKDAKEKIVNMLANEKRVGYTKVYRDFHIGYLKTGDSFLVGIRGIDTQKAKYWATMWFKLNGISDQGLCRLPVIFYIESGILSQIQPFNIEFNPLPDNCK